MPAIVQQKPKRIGLMEGKWIVPSFEEDKKLDEEILSSMMDYTQCQQDLFAGMSIDEIGSESRKVSTLVAPLIHGQEV